MIGRDRAYAVTRRKDIAKQRLVWRLCQRYPRAARRLIRHLNAKQLAAGYPADEHFKPVYNPWDQRLCAVPDADMFKAIRDGRASVVTEAPIGVGQYLADLASADAQAIEVGLKTADVAPVAVRPAAAPPLRESAAVRPEARLVSAVAPAPAGTSASVLASDRGAGVLGFAGTAGKESVGRPAGLTTLAGGEFGGSPSVPMVPASWEQLVGAGEAG